MILTHGINSLTTSKELFFEFFSELLSSTDKTKLSKITVNNVQYEYINDKNFKYNYTLESPPKLVEFDAILNMSDNELLFGIKDSSVDNSSSWLFLLPSTSSTSSLFHRIKEYEWPSMPTIIETNAEGGSGQLVYSSWQSYGPGSGYNTYHNAKRLNFSLSRNTEVHCKYDIDYKNLTMTMAINSCYIKVSLDHSNIDKIYMQIPSNWSSDVSSQNFLFRNLHIVY